MTVEESGYVVIGGGIVGASIAYHLSERTSAPVTVFDQQALASETTYKSMAMFGLYGDEVQRRMKRYGLSLYNEFFTAPAARPKYDLAGRLEVATTEHDAGLLEQEVARTSGEMIAYVPGDRLGEAVLVPGLNTAPVVGAAFRPNVGFLNPHELAHEFVARARANGVDFRTGTRVTGVTTKGGRVSGVETEHEHVTAAGVVCAAGPWNVQFCERIGVGLPVRHTHAPILKLDPDERAEYSLPAIGHYGTPYRIYRQRARSPGAMYLGCNPAQPMDSLREFRRTYGVLHPDEVGEKVPGELRDGMLETAGLLMPRLLDAPVTDEWVGIRSGTPDGNPVIGWTDLPRFLVAAFHTSGIQLAPKTGEIIARQLVDGDPTSLYEGVSVARFDGYTDVHDGAPPQA